MLQTIAKTILKRLFRVYAHIYHQHFKEIVSLGEEAHLNTSFKHFVYFIQASIIAVHINSYRQYFQKYFNILNTAFPTCTEFMANTRDFR